LNDFSEIIRLSLFLIRVEYLDFWSVEAADSAFAFSLEINKFFIGLFIEEINIAIVNDSHIVFSAVWRCAVSAAIC
jgi:hypothetical protein